LRQKPGEAPGFLFLEAEVTAGRRREAIAAHDGRFTEHAREFIDARRFDANVGSNSPILQHVVAMFTARYPIGHEHHESAP
jgi:hypothetical protein